MPEFNMTNTEEMEMIKRWWNNYGKYIAVVVLIALLAGFGWRYWKHHKLVYAQQASLLYEQLNIAASQKRPKLARSLAAQLLNKYSDSPYAAMASLWWAQQLVQKNKLNAAYQKCHWVIEHSPVKRFKQVARLRASRILLAKNNPQAALKMLSKTDDTTFQPAIDEAKGDLYTAMKKPAAAHKAYKLAKTGFSVAGMNNPILTMKLAQ